jgi:thiopurine S-methyltransferase
MKREFWLEKWNKNIIGFHKDKPNKLLTRYLDKLELNPSSFIFVPLCGKSLDLVYLAQLGHKVIGIELSEIAVKDFFKENEISYEIQEVGNLLKYASDKIDIYLGDIFELSAQMLGPIDAVYDRAAMIALPIDLRKKYNQKIDELTDSQTKLLLITLEYDQQRVSGPPFSIPLETINIKGLELVFEHKPQLLNPKFIEANVEVLEKVYIKR